MDKRLFDFHDQYIRATERKAPVEFQRILIARLAKVAKEGIGFKADRVYISTFALKHMFDSRQAQEYEIILKKLNQVINQPECIYENLDEKRGELLVVKKFISVDFEKNQINETILCSLDVSDHELGVATAFRQFNDKKVENYLKKYRLLWRWEGD